MTRRLVQLIEWIAFNDDDANETDEQRASEYVTTTMLAHVYGLSPRALGHTIIGMRQARAKREDG